MGISIVFARGIVAELQSRGFDPYEFLKRIGFEHTRLGELRETLTLEELDRMACEAMAMTGDPGLGLAIGANAPESMLQIFGYLMVAQHTLRDAIASVRRYSTLLSEAATWNLLESGDTAIFTCNPNVYLGDATRCAIDYALALSARIMRHFAPPTAPIPFQQAHFQHAMPSYAGRYRELFGCPVLFGRENNALLFPRRYLDLPQFHGDDMTRSLLRETAERLLQERTRAQSVADRVRGLLRYEAGLSKIDVERLARQLGLTPRALRRRLGAEGMPLSALLDEARCRVACDELRRPESTIKETAERLGFSEPSAFHRAFKRWTGQTPAQYTRISAQEASAQARANLVGPGNRPREQNQSLSRPG